MSTNGNGKWFHAHWVGNVRLNPTRSGWYAAIPEDCSTCGVTRVHIEENLLDVYVEGNALKYDVYDFEWWHPLKTPHDDLPNFDR